MDVFCSLFPLQQISSGNMEKKNSQAHGNAKLLKRFHVNDADLVTFTPQPENVA